MGPNLIALAIPLFFVGIAIEFGVAKAKGRAGYRPGAQPLIVLVR